MDYNITTENIELIPISGKTTLFFHSDSLQIYPLNDKVLINFLLSIKNYGIEITKQKYKNNKFCELYNYIIKKINTSPITTIYPDLDNQNKKYITIVLPISAKCNLNCPYCFAKTDNGYNFQNFTTQSINEIAEFLINNIKENEHLTIIFFGGEPLLNMEVIKYTVTLFKTKYPNQSINYSITTNGTILDKRIITFFKENKFSVLLSIDGPDNEFNLRKYKNGKSSFSKVMKNIELLKKNNIGFELRATLINNNPYIVETFEFFENLHIPFNIVFAYNSENKANSHLNTYDVNIIYQIEEQLDALLKYYIDKFKRQEKSFNIFFKSISEVLRYRLNKSTICSAGIYYHTIMSNGDIYTCAHLMNDNRYKIGNIHSGYNSNSAYFPVPIHQIYECQTCWIKNICLGGCPSQKISMGKKNDIAMENNICHLEKIKTRFYIKLYYYATKNFPNYFTNEN